MEQEEIIKIMQEHIDKTKTEEELEKLRQQLKEKNIFIKDKESVDKRT